MCSRGDCTSQDISQVLNCQEFFNNNLKLIYFELNTILDKIIQTPSIIFFIQ